MNILVTGSNGQLGNEIKDIAAHYPEHQFVFTDVAELDICNLNGIASLCTDKNIQLIINTAAYTNVDKAEIEKEQAFAINAMAVDNLCHVCKKHNIKLIHISTDYVFDGNNKEAYVESDKTNATSTYGQSKQQGEENILKSDISAAIIRTSWLYSSYGNNFVKTILRLATEKKILRVVNDQSGAPTYARDLAQTLGNIMLSSNFPKKPEIFHYANMGKTNWYEFAKEIMQAANIDIEIIPIPTSAYPTPALRPANSLFCLDKIQHTFGIQIPHWKNSVNDCLLILNKK